MTPARSPETSEVPLDVRVTRGSATEEELAAVVAVVSDAYSQEPAAVAEEAGMSAWQRSQRGLRTTLRRDQPGGTRPR